MFQTFLTSCLSTLLPSSWPQWDSSHQPRPRASPCVWSAVSSAESGSVSQLHVGVLPWPLKVQIYWVPKQGFFKVPSNWRCWKNPVNEKPINIFWKQLLENWYGVTILVLAHLTNVLEPKWTDLDIYFCHGLNRNFQLKPLNLSSPLYSTLSLLHPLPKFSSSWWRMYIFEW